MFMYHVLLLTPSTRPTVKLFIVCEIVLAPKTYCLRQCRDMATIHPTMQKE